VLAWFPLHTISWFHPLSPSHGLSPRARLR
jgi:hypothetical protein